MPTASGIDGQVMYANETVYGTAVAVTRGIPHVDYSVTEKVAAIESKSVTPASGLRWSPVVARSGLRPACRTSCAAGPRVLGGADVGRGVDVGCRSVCSHDHAR